MADDNNAEFKPFGIDLGTTGRYAAGGALAGVSLASLLALVKEFHKMKTEHELGLDNDNPTSGENIVLTLPKTAGLNKTANWQTLVASLLAAPVAGYPAYALMDQLLASKRLKELSEERDAAKNEYLDLLLKARRPDMLKTSEDTQSSFKPFDYLIGLPILATVLGAGGTAWLTKRVLENYDSNIPESQKHPRIRKVLYKMEGNDVPGLKRPEDDKAEDEEIVEFKPGSDETVKAACAVFMDICSGSPDILADQRCVDYLEKTGSSPAEIYKLADEDIDRLVGKLEMDPELRSIIKRVSMERHPILKYLKWAVDIPGIAQLTDIPLYGRINKLLGSNINTMSPMSKTSGIIPGIPDGTGPHGRGMGPGGGLGCGKASALLAVLKNTKADKKKKDEGDKSEAKSKKKSKKDKSEDMNKKDAQLEKEAQLGVLQSLVGSTLAEGMAPKSDSGRRLQAETSENTDKTDNRDAITVEGLDEGSRKFILENKDKIKTALEILARQGKI